MKYKKYSYEELRKMEQSSIPLTKRNLEGIVFGYADLIAGEGELGEYDGFSIVLFDTGTVEVREYLFSEILLEERHYSVPQSCISEIQQLYQKYHDEIQTMYAPDNDSCDGGINYFYFGNHWMDALNIDYTNEKEIEQIREVNPNPVEFEEVMAIVREENKIMKFLFSICEILQRYDIVLTQYDVTINGESTATHADFYATDNYFCKFLLWCKSIFQKSNYHIMQFLKKQKSIDKNKQK